MSRLVRNYYFFKTIVWYRVCVENNGQQLIKIFHFLIETRRLDHITIINDRYYVQHINYIHKLHEICLEYRGECLKQTFRLEQFRSVNDTL